MKLPTEWHRVQSAKLMTGTRPSRQKTFQYFQQLNISGGGTTSVSHDYDGVMNHPGDNGSRSSESSATSSPNRSSSSPSRRSDHHHHNLRECEYL